MNRSVLKSCYVLGLPAAIAILTAINFSASAQPSPTPSISPSQPTTSLTAVNQQLVGEWQLKDIFPVGIKVIFTKEGKLFIFLPVSFPFFGGWTQNPVAYELNYQINPNTQPMQIDITEPEGFGRPKLMTIFELPAESQMRVEWVGLNPGDSRPTEFTTGAIVLEKLSTITALPRNTKIERAIGQTATGKESEAQQNISSVNKAQTTYRAEKSTFANTFDLLALGVLTGGSRAETTNYSYEIVVANADRTMTTAAAKIGPLKSYTGAVFFYRDSQDRSVMISIICETDGPSSQPPAMPILTKSAAGAEIKCGAGSQKLEP